MKLWDLWRGHSPRRVTCVQCTTHTTKSDDYTVEELSESGPPELPLAMLEAGLRMGVIQDTSMLHNIISQWQKVQIILHMSLHSFMDKF